MSLPNEPNDVTGLYEIIFDEKNHSTAPVRILEGTFKDFVYKYGAIQVGDFNEDDSDVPLKYEYELLEAPESYALTLDPDHESEEQNQFEQLIGDVLYDIIVNSDTVKEATNGNRNDDSK